MQIVAILIVLGVTYLVGFSTAKYKCDIKKYAELECSESDKKLGIIEKCNCGHYSDGYRDCICVPCGNITFNDNIILGGKINDQKDETTK